MVNSPTTTDPTNDFNPMLPNVVTVDFFDGILVTTNDYRRFVNPKKEDLILIQKVFKGIFFQGDIKGSVVWMIDNVFHDIPLYDRDWKIPFQSILSSIYFFLGEWMAIPKTSANASYITSE